MSIQRQLFSATFSGFSKRMLANSIVFSSYSIPRWRKMKLAPFAVLLLYVALDASVARCSDDDSVEHFENDRLTSFHTDVKKRLRKDQISTSLSDCAVRGKPWNSYHKVSKNPDIIVFPESTEDVSEILKLCFQHGIAVVPFGGGTSIEGQTLAINGGCSIDFSNMKKVLELNEADLDVNVQAGIGYIELNEMLKKRNIWFPLDPGESLDRIRTIQSFY